MAKLWGGRFKEPLHPDAKAFSFSLDIDKRLAEFDLQVNLAHAKALHKKNILTDKEYSDIESCLTSIDLQFSEDDEDIHSCVERNVTEALGDLGKKLHTGKSRNDQVITDVRLFTKKVILDIQTNLKSVLKSLWTLADTHQDVIFPGFTHFQPAQPILFAHHLLAYFEKFSRDVKRFDEAFQTADVSTLGSGALAGNNYELDREFIAKELGFSSITNNSMDGVSDRDFILETLSASSICMTHLSRLSEEIVLWTSPLIGFVSLGDSFTTGSSMMPQKKNPDIAELIRGKSSRVVGNQTAMLHCLKALPLTYNRDLQEDKEFLFDSVDTVRDSLNCMAKMLETLTINQEAIDRALTKGYLLATELADYLVAQGVPFRESHEVTGKIVIEAIQNNKQIEEIDLETLKSYSPKIDESVYTALTMKAAVDSKSVFGGTAAKQVKHQLKRIKEQNPWIKH